jgi:hypothetical protein
MRLDTKENTEDKISHKDALKNSLKHLEFILFFEMHLEQREKSSCSWHFLKAFEDIKQEAKMNVLKYSAYPEEY